MSVFAQRCLKGALLLAIECGAGGCGLVAQPASNTSDGAKELWSAIVWGPATNGVRAGVLARKVDGSEVSRSDWRVLPAFAGLATNDVLVWLAPPVYWKIELYDEVGRPVSKTNIGRQWGKKIELPRRGLQDAGFDFTRATATFPSLVGRGFQLRDVFDVNTLGVYRLEVSWAGVIITNGSKMLTQFAPVSVRLDLVK